MSACVTLHLQTQVASIMEVLAKSAVVEIGKAIDEGTAVFLLEMSRSKKENETLKWRLLELEKELLDARRVWGNRATARDRIRSVKVQVGSYEEERSLSIDSVFGKEWSIDLWKDGELTAKKEEEAPLQPVINEEAGIIQEMRPMESDLKTTLTVEDRQDLLPIKVELFEENLEDSDPWGGIMISGGLEPERDSTERQHGEESDPQPASAEVTEEPYTRPTAAGGRLEEHTLPVTMEGTAEPHTPPAPPESTAGSEDARPYFLPGKNTNAAKRFVRIRLACTHCGKNFSYFSSFQKHQQTCSSRSGKHFCQKAELARHESPEIGQKTFKNSQFSCEHCTKTFSSSYDLETHRAIHSEKPFHCNDCGKYYFEKWRLDSHLCSRSGEEPYKCIECGNGFSQEVHLRLHQCSYRREKPYSCVEIGDNSSQKSAFESQQNIYREDDFYSCAACKKSFTNINIFHQHLCNHTGKKSHRCLECGKCFSERRSLHLHQRTVHRGEKPYSCAECGKNFSHKGNLRKHQAIHTGEKPYSCAECGKNFSQKCHLQNHQVTHTGEKPYKCLECGKSFTEKGYLKKHNLIHRGVKPHRCRECGKCFSRKGYLNSHEQKHRRETIQVL